MQCRMALCGGAEVGCTDTRGTEPFWRDNGCPGCSWVLWTQNSELNWHKLLIYMDPKIITCIFIYVRMQLFFIKIYLIDSIYASFLFLELLFNLICLPSVSWLSNICWESRHYQPLCHLYNLHGWKGSDISVLLAVYERVERSRPSIWPLWKPWLHQSWHRKAGKMSLYNATWS